jgi:hypothetical protein
VITGSISTSLCSNGTLTPPIKNTDTTKPCFGATIAPSPVSCGDLAGKERTDLEIEQYSALVRER